MQSAHYSCQILRTLAFSRQIFENSSNIKFHKNLSSGSRDAPCEQADMTKPIIANNMPKNVEKPVNR